MTMTKFLMNICYKRPFNVCMLHTVSQRKVVTSNDENPELMAMWPNIVKDLTEFGSKFNFSDVPKWSAKVLQYNVPMGKMTRASDVVYAYKQLAHSDQLTDENIRLALTLGWCCQILQAFVVVEDDIIDNSITRRGQPCWHLQDNIGLAAVNDALLLEQMIFKLLRMHFRQKDYYLNLVETFHDNIQKILIGQTLEFLSTNRKESSLNLFTMERYNSIVKYKSTFYTFDLPFTLAMHHAGIKDNDVFKQTKTVLLELGNLFQVQYDCIDFFGNPEVTGKIGTDIEEGKCTWLIVVALQRVTSAQRKILEECYGVNDPEKVEKVKQLYHELGLPAIYTAWEKEKYNLIKSHIQQIPSEIPHDLFFKQLNRLYCRNM
ncbi:farnesyl pyrophosphate synthase-like [Leptopilina boulardi]|uniref:farnesyl pyrophosphate synthase-like n=1 Tax=Leptopilina boulardi TaxID=63433 RepID=UPI0021F4FDFC|nr:farnesyl pyrophosphate synthase-like [Leptopilina boulardi]XP_051158399.1 farnesyl pyrophosphate synthase-like [Leptopilina boulardi]